jgi:hypothetical protein
MIMARQWQQRWSGGGGGAGSGGAATTAVVEVGAGCTRSGPVVRTY